MQCIQSYGGSSSDSESDNGEAAAFLLPIDPKDSVANTLSIVTAPEVVPMVSAPNYSKNDKKYLKSNSEVKSCNVFITSQKLILISG